MKTSTESLHTSVEPQLATHKAAIEAFFKGVEEHDADLIAPLLAQDVLQEIPYNSSGSTTPAARFEGKKAVMGYWTQVVTNFSRTVLVDKRIYAAEDGTVFCEGTGDLVHAATGAAYKNLYVFKFVFRSNLVSQITEYSNPVIFAKLVGAPIG